MFSLIMLIIAWFILLYVGTTQNLHFTIKTFLVWLMLMYVGINLIGFVVRNLASWVSPLDDVSGDFKNTFNREIRLNRSAGKALCLIFIVLTVAYLIAIYHYWNVILVACAALIIISRLPDLLWEIRTGQRASKANIPKGIFSNIGIVIDILTLPLTWFALYKWGT